ncbi:MAG: hypothetical protein KDD67_10265 [Ignavibacteriae bacterium]|nr:hypothetical protein [Ignavibacteriota bacterium]MCB9214812.1 hypothetical protein [Ignavibacteria bacterium]
MSTIVQPLNEEESGLFRRRPDVVEAFRTTRRLELEQPDGRILIAEPGDMVVTGILNDQYPVKYEAFMRTYERVSSSPYDVD